jgi:hypothetical protein
MKNTRGGTMYKEVDTEVIIEVDDVLAYISHYATEDEIKLIAKELISTGYQLGKLFKDTGLEGSLVREEKMLLLSAAFEKFSLEELEEILGTKYSLK